MYYASVALMAMIVHVIINYESLKKVVKTGDNLVYVRFRYYLVSLLCFYVADIFWGLFYDKRWVIPTYIVTCLFFLSMVVSVLFWTMTVVEFVGSKGRLGKVLVICGWIVFLFEVAVLVINLFHPIVFWFREDKEYMPMPARHITLLMQMVLFFSASAYSLVMALRTTGKRMRHYRTTGFSGIIMSIFIFLQMFYPLMPFYSMGCLIGSCLIHTFVYKDRADEQDQQMKMANQKAYRDGLTGVKNKLAYLEALAEIETGIKNGSVKEFGVAVFDLNGLKTINDTLGHEAGDKYIKDGCMLICHQFEHSPVFRIGGDEFVVILRDGDYENREALNQAFREQIDENQAKDLVVVSSGMAVFIPGLDEEYNDVFKRADELMYERKIALKARK